MKLFSSKPRVIAIAALVVLFLFLLRPGASRLKSRIIYSISSAVGRPVDIGSVHLRFLPRPGFDLENLVVYDDPAFGAEPILRAGEVTAALRLTSLVRGRLEIAQLDLNEPSLNLVHGQNGRWNLEALLERTARTPTAPTAKPNTEPRPAFPYIEASSARINFKNGPEKKPYALTNADFSLWQDSENTFGIRLKAQPFRTDRNLNDTGMLQVNGTWQRAGNLRDTPLQLKLRWDRAQLGQVTKFFTGNDQGWRGTAQLDVTLTGTPADLTIVSDSTLEDFRRFDITNGAPLRLAAHCEARYSSGDHTFREVTCAAPAGKGTIALRGTMGFPGSHNYDLRLSAEDVPASSALALVEHVKKNLPDDLVAQGLLSGNFSLVGKPSGADSRFEGEGEIAELQLISLAAKAEMGPETIPFRFADSSEIKQRPKADRKGTAGIPNGPHVEFGPFSVIMGRGTAPTARAWVNRAGYGLSLAGDTEIAKVLRMARIAGIPAPTTTADGAAQVDLQISGWWAGWNSGQTPVLVPPQVTGTAKLRNVHVAVRGVESPVEISSADLQLGPEAVKIEKLTARAADSLWTGSLSLPRGCGAPGACLVHFDLKADQISISALNQWAHPSPKETPWYRVLGSNAQPAPSLLGSLRATGRLKADRLQLKTLAATNVVADVSLDSGAVVMTTLTADFLGGKHSGQWQADFAAKPAMCNGSGSLIGVSFEPLADAMHDQHLAGSASGSYDVKGECNDFWPSAEGQLQFDVRNGTVPGMSVSEEHQPLLLTRFSGTALLRKTRLEMKDAAVDSASGKFLVSGTATFSRELDLKLHRPANHSSGDYAVTGTLAEPHVEPLSRTEQAKLKTDPAK